MSESTQAPPSRKKKLVIAGLGAAAVIVLTAGTIVGVNVSSGNKTEQLCTEATAAAQQTAKTVKNSVEASTKARAEADGAEGYAKREGAEALLKEVESTKGSLGKIKLTGDCDTREGAEKLQGDSKAAKTQTTKLDGATKKLTADVAAYKEAEAKRIADEKAAADAKAAEAKAAEEKAAADAAAEQAAAEQAAAEAAAAAPAPAPAAQPQYAGGGVGYAPAPQAPQYKAPAPAPAPYVPAPAPAPAPVTGGGGGWTPPPAGQGGGGGCTQINGYTMCSGG